MNSSHTTRTAVPSRTAFPHRDLAFAGMIAAILAIISQISVPMPTGVPITIQVFGITLIGVAFGWRLGTLRLSRLTYRFVLSGLPIFANFRGGFSVLVDLTGGIYLVLASHGGYYADCRLNLKIRNWKLPPFFSFLSLVWPSTKQPAGCSGLLLQATCLYGEYLSIP